MRLKIVKWSIKKGLGILAVFLFTDISSKLKGGSITWESRPVTACGWGPGGRTKGSPRGTRRTRGDRPALRLGHSDDFKCVCTCVCQMPQAAHKCGHLYSNKAVEMVIEHRISQYVTKLQRVESDETWSPRGRGSACPPCRAPQPRAQSQAHGSRERGPIVHMYTHNTPHIPTHHIHVYTHTRHAHT